MSQPNHCDFSGNVFRDALGMFATGVTLITTRAADGSPTGLTANSFNSVSLDPPLVLWSLKQRSTLMATFKQSSHFVVNILAADQIALAQRFARHEKKKWDDVIWHAGASNMPIIDGALAWFECARRSSYKEGDHIIFVGEVQQCARARQATPLLFHGGQYYTERLLDPS